MDYKYLLEMMLTHLDEGILVVDNDANVTFFNEPASNIAGIDSNEAIGKNILDIFPGLTPETSTFYYVLKTKKPLIDYVQNYINYKGKKVSTVTSTIPLIKNQEIIGAMEIYRDLTYTKELSDKIYSLQEKISQYNSTPKSCIKNGTEYTFDDIIGESSAIRALKEKAKKVADSVSPVLVYGETGTGKELLVQAIHNASIKRSSKPFIAQNCAALPATLLEGILFGTSSGSFTGAKDKPGLFELANGGTLFLDEINSMPIELQAKLLRVLQDSTVRRLGGENTITVDVRVIASTNEEPSRAVENGLLREDLYYRLNVVPLRIPPLRERQEDIYILVDHFIKLYNNKLNRNIKEVSPRVMSILLNRMWPGNVRELKCTIENIMNFVDKEVIYLDEITFNSCDNMLSVYKHKNEPYSYNECSIPPLNEAVDKYEKDLIIKAIEQVDGNHAKAARLLKVPKQTLYNKVKKYQINCKVKIE
ncbi:MAG: sigma-54 interaction domain-containing protein [Caulobacteraceae bacterium]